MNEINSSKRLKYAVAERAEGDKILQVKAAEAEAEVGILADSGSLHGECVLKVSSIFDFWSQAKYLSGVGVAKQRKAIVDGLRTSIVDFSDAVGGSSTKEVMDLLLLTQYFDMIRDVGQANHCKTTFTPAAGSSNDIRNALLQAHDGA